MTLFEKLFIGGDWHIATRINTQLWPINYDVPFSEVKGKRGYWYADPLLFEYRGNPYLFCEAFNKKRQAGEISVFTFNGNKWIGPQIIISPNYHVSYPCVFEYKDACYMIPESQEAKCLEIYRAEQFPYKWVKIKSLLANCVIADPTIVSHDDILYLLGYSGKNPYSLCIYQLDMDNLELRYLDIIEYEENTGRPAGRLFPYEKGFIRPSQDCRYMYGDSIIWNSVEMEHGKFKEKVIGSVDKGKIKVIGVNHLDRVHTFDRCGNLEVIDYNIHTFDLFKRVKILWRKYKRWERR